MDERWPVLFQTLEATDENDLDFAIPVFRLRTHSDNEEEDRTDRVGTYRAIRDRMAAGTGESWNLFCGEQKANATQKEVWIKIEK